MCLLDTAKSDIKIVKHLAKHVATNALSIHPNA